MIVRRATDADLSLWAEMLARLHGGQTPAEFERELQSATALAQPFVAFLAFTDGGLPIGLIDARMRNYAEGAPNLAAAYVEDLWVDPAHRRSGVARALLAAVEQWARSEGADWLGSDTDLGNVLSQAWHAAVGFREIERLVVFGKPLD